MESRTAPSAKGRVVDCGAGRNPGWNGRVERIGQIVRMPRAVRFNEIIDPSKDTARNPYFTQHPGRLASPIAQARCQDFKTRRTNALNGSPFCGSHVICNTIPSASDLPAAMSGFETIPSDIPTDQDLPGDAGKRQGLTRAEVGETGRLPDQDTQAILWLRWRCHVHRAAGEEGFEVADGNIEHHRDRLRCVVRSVRREYHVLHFQERVVLR